MVHRLMTGGHLGQRIPPQGLAAADALAIFEPVAAAVASAHRHGVVHGRLRPQNVMFDGDGNAYVADLGVDEICAGRGRLRHDRLRRPRAPRVGCSPRRRPTSTPSASSSTTWSAARRRRRRVAAAAGDGRGGGGDRPAPWTPIRAAGPSVVELVGKLRAALAVRRRTTARTFAPARNPYRGLAAFEQADAADFFGRDRAIGDMLDVHPRRAPARRRRPVGHRQVIGRQGRPASPRCAPARSHGSDRWLVTEMTPGDSPFEQLAAALDRVATAEVADVVGELTSGRPLGVTAQRLVPPTASCSSSSTSSRSCSPRRSTPTSSGRSSSCSPAWPTRTAPNVRIVVTLRADHFDRPLASARFGEAMRGRTVALGGDDRRRAGRGGAADRRWRSAWRSSRRSCSGSSATPNASPVPCRWCSTAWPSCSTGGGRTRSPAPSTSTRGRDARGASAGGPRRSTASWTPTSATTCGSVFLALVNVNEDREDTRRRVRRSELEQQGLRPDELDALLGEFGRHRLLTFDRDPASRTPDRRGRPRGAAGALAAPARLDRRAHATTCSPGGTSPRPPPTGPQPSGDASFLYGGGRLDMAESWAAHTDVHVAADERRFLAASRAKADRDAHSKRPPAARARRRARRRRWSLTTSLGVFAMPQRANADHQARDARARQLASDARLAIDEDPERAVLLAMAAMTTTSTPLPEAVSALQSGHPGDRVS